MNPRRWLIYETAARIEPAFAEKNYERSGETQSPRRGAGQTIGGREKRGLEAAHRAIADLNALGFNFRLVEGPGTSKAGKPPKERTEGEASRRQTKDLPCPICQFRTEPHHDGRAHRSQEPKRPFTEEELSEKGLAKVA